MHAVSRASKFGLRFTTADKRRAIELVIGANPKMSDRKVAEAVGVDNKTVAATRERLSKSGEEIPHSGSKNGAGIDHFLTKFRKLFGEVTEENRATFAEKVLAILTDASA